MPQPLVRSAGVRGERRCGGGNAATTRTGVYMNLFHLEHGLCWVQSGVLPKGFGHKLFFFLSAQLDNV